MDQTYFTDQEYRLLLCALHRERLVCEGVDQESKQLGSGQPLVPIINRIERKIRHIQYHSHDVAAHAAADQRNMEDDGK